MIFENQFPQWKKTAKTIDKEQFFVNLIVRRIKENEYPPTPYVANGVIHIDRPADKNEGYYGGILAHESNHLVHDPITFWNYISGINEIKKRLDTKDNTENWLANLASDLIIENNLSKNPILKEYSKKSYEFGLQKITEQTNAIQEKLKNSFPDIKIDGGPKSEHMNEFVGIISKWHGFATPGIPEPKNYDKVMEIINSTRSREKKYVDIARIFKPLLDKDMAKMPKYVIVTKQTDKDGKEQQVEIPLTEEEKNQIEKRRKLMPLNPSKKDLREAKEKIFGNSKTADEAKEKLRQLKELVKSNKSISAEGHFELEIPDKDFIPNFYNAKAEQLLISIDFPRMPARKGLEVSSKKWKLSDSLHQMDVRKTVMKKGMSIPTVTTLTPKIIPKFVSDIKQTKPLDLVISIDTSGSTGYPSGSMQCEADYELILLFAILKKARMIDQKVGMTLWTTELYYAVDPVGWKDFDRLLKQAIFTRWSSGGTTMSLALDYAVKHPNQFHFIFTDGAVFDGRLDKVKLKKYMEKLHGRIHFFLVQNYAVEDFKWACGADHVTYARDLNKLPSIVLNEWKDIFWKR